MEAPGIEPGSLIASHHRQCLTPISLKE